MARAVRLLVIAATFAVACGDGDTLPPAPLSTFHLCGCVDPALPVCIWAPDEESFPSCVARQPCDGPDICACLTGLGTCTPRGIDNQCICDGVAN
jgi:hypothetical protein